METGDLKKWHLAIGISIVSGILVWAYTQIGVESDQTRTTSPTMFEAELLYSPRIGKTNPQPVVSNIHVAPAGNGLYVVNFDRLVADRKHDQWLKQQWTFTAMHPTHDSKKTIIEWLDDLTRTKPDISYTYEWWREPGRLWTYYGVFAGVLMIWGVAIPLTMWVAKGGLREFKEDATAAPPPAPMPVSSSIPSDADDRLNEMLDRLEENAAAGVTSGGVPVAAAAAAGEGPVRKLEAKPLDVSAAEKEEEKKDYAGQFYPVARSGKKD